MIEQDPEHDWAYHVRGWIYYRRAAQQAYASTKGPNELATLAVAHAELGEFDKAVEWQTKAIAAAPMTQKEQYQARRKLYEEKKPFRFE
ncbi:MAG: hypothetical protein EXS09_12510 [Gemmataceae bacterium]|nr:hypothetical protein [Gemmataceae bacterium]